MLMRLIRCNSTLRTLTPDGIKKHFVISYARSSGAGGQHVNTTDSKAVIKLPLDRWYAARGSWIPSKQFDNIMKNVNDSDAPHYKKFPYFTSSGDILITSSETRYRDKNLNDCLEKFVKAVEVCGQVRDEVNENTKQHWDKLKKRDNEERLKSKKLKRDKKSARRKISLDF
ncbi:uncharacterized protein C5L36_0A09820 [Pichia kudriavzevii]|uniref:Prokaryotic-type class I peptide chain release factors domain-containing protein n=1 Tax=Pichia kudriavzevii TaxID=4909 RepID=A0A2U9QZF5_PICKU|nr:uncharacterized protein C5L36_0A09820 [Pichia kudriavzevii]AWU74395.1 hypothetical protein C5L36_0A09820 [Pichia kudriavzevii]